MSTGDDQRTQGGGEGSISAIYFFIPNICSTFYRINEEDSAKVILREMGYYLKLHENRFRGSIAAGFYW